MEKTTCSRKKLLFRVKQLLDAHQISFWLDTGTLLGAYRDKNFIVWDKDMDISLFDADYWKVRKILSLTNLKYKHIWRRELSIYLENNPEEHIDLFFYDTDKTNAYGYAYLENKITKDIHVESRFSFPKYLLESFKKIQFLQNKFDIPAKTDEFLTCHYGDWRIKQKEWYYSKKPNIDRNHCAIAIIIPTFLREDKLINCVNSILKTYNEVNRFQPFFRIYIGDQGEISQNKKDLYDKLESAGHKIFKLYYNCGLSYARNYLIAQSTEPYILLIDDDYIFTEQSHLEAFFRILLEDEHIGLVGGKLADRDLKPMNLCVNAPINNNNSMVHIVNPEKWKYTLETRTQKSVKYFDTEYILNFFLAKREVFNDIKWDEELKLVEHSDFLLRLKTTKWKAVYTPEVIIEHHPENNSTEYQSFRDAKTGKNCILGLYKFKQKYNLKNNTQYINTLSVENTYLAPSKIKIVQMARIPCANSGLELSNLINKYSTTFEARYILGNEYSSKNQNIPYRKFPTDLFFETQREECIKVLKEADIIHIHHDIINDPEILHIIKAKKVIWTLYNLSQSLQYKNNSFNINYINKCQSLSNLVTVADQSLQRKLFSDITDIKVPLVKMLFNENINKNNKYPLIVFAPTNRLDEEISTKKYNDVIKTINELKNEGYKFEFNLIEGVPYEENLERKRRADILIDDIDPMWEKFHNSSLEAACFGAIALTNYSGTDYPFYKTDVSTLKSHLIKLLSDCSYLKQEQQKIIDWRNKEYVPEKLLKIYENIYTDTINGKYFLKDNFIAKSTVPVEIVAPIPTNTLTIKEMIYDIINKINSLKIPYWIIKDSCLELVTKKEIISNKFYIGVASVIDKNLIANHLIKYSTFLDITIESQKETKAWKLYDLDINVPFPLIGYLESYTKMPWDYLKTIK